MKLFIGLIIIISVLLAAAGTTQQPAVTYTHNFPVDMDSALRQYYIKVFEKGRISYRINCAECHNTKAGSSEIIPIFSKESLARYELRVQNPDHVTNLSDVQISNEEYQTIMVFLNFLKKVDNTASPARQRR